jgi:hypothetical protein
MDWLEQLFGLNPDGGDGSMEALITAAAVLVVVTVVTVGVPRLRARAADVFHRTVSGLAKGRQAR